MKKYILPALLALLCFPLSIRSAGEHYLTSIAPKGASWLEFDDEAYGIPAVVLPAQGGIHMLHIKTNLKANVATKPSWLKATLAGTGLYQLDVKPNTGEATREGLITLKGKDGKTLTVSLVQYGTESDFRVNKKKIALYGDEPFDSIFIQSNASYTLDKPTWLKIQSAEDGKYIFTAENVYDVSNRTGVINLKDSTGAVRQTIDVIQHYYGSSWFKKPCFAVISDIHFGDDNAGLWYNRMPRVLKTLSSHDPKIQCVFVVGDLANNGKESQYKDIVSYFGNPDLMDQSIPQIFIRGNHDHYNGETGLAAYDRIINQPANRYMDILGYPFITLGSNSGDYRGSYCYSTETMEFLKQSLADAAQKYPDKPIFVMQHVLPYHTVIGSYENDYAAYALGLDEVLSLYPQVIDISAHTHMGITDPHQIYQKNYTALNDGSQKRDSNPTYFPGWYQLGAEQEIDYGCVTEGFVIHIDDEDQVIVERWNTSRNIKYDEDWVIPPPFDGTNFTYKDRNGGKAPWWPEGAKVTVSNLASTSCHITFPHAIDDGDVNLYYIDVYNSAGKTVRTQIKQCALLNMGHQRPAEMVIPISGLPSGTELRVTVRAQDFYDLNSPTLSATFTLP